MRKLLSWLDDNLISILAGFLLVFIPLYPKLPLFEALPGYIVRVRLEDFFVFTTAFLWLIWLIRGKISLDQNPIIKWIGIYLAIGILSMVSAIFIIQTVPFEALHIGKMVLHFLRRIEYFSLFFIFYTTIRSMRQVKIYLLLLIAVVVAVTLYGYGQKYLYWPAFSTMNREFSKGWVLYLTAHARVLSTFGGHYDLAAFTMMILIILWSLFLGVKNLLYKALIFLILSGAFWLLILTASRTSFLAYLAGITIMCFLWAFRQGLRWSFLSWIAITFLSIFIMLSFGDLSDRFMKLLKLDERLGGIRTLVLNPFGKPPDDLSALFLENNPATIADVTSKTDQPPSPVRPVDVTEDIPLKIPSASGIVTVKRTYSQNAIMYDLSTGIRFDALWPRAIAGFKRNPILGSGYSTLTKVQVEEFTEAESTDNDFLRSLGETGLLGFIAFYGILISMLVAIWKTFTKVKDPVFYSFIVGFAGLIIGLLVNAAYIDVFEASKVAYAFWALAGITFGGLKVLKKDIQNSNQKPYIPDIHRFQVSAKIKVLNFIKSDVFRLILLLLLAFLLRNYKINMPLADWHSWRQSDTSSVTRDFIKNGINLLYPTYQDLSNVASGKDNLKGLRMVEFPLYNAYATFIDKIFVGWNIEFSGRLASVFASLLSLIFLFKFVRRYLGRTGAFFAALFFAIIPYNIYFSRVILPEPFLVTLSLGFLYYLDRFLFDNVKIFKRFLLLIISLIFLSLALLVKPFAIFMFIPAVYLWYRKYGFSKKFFLGLLVYWLIALLPLWWWRQWISNFPEGVPAYEWLLNGDGIRFKGAFFQWLFAERITKLILGYWGVSFLLLGILVKFPKETNVFYFYLLGMLTYISVVATGNVRHDYYQTFIVPLLCIFLAKGVMFLLSHTAEIFSQTRNLITIILVIAFMEAFGWYQIRDFYNINHPEIVEAGRTLDRLTPQKALVIAPYEGDTAFLYQTGRKGWPIVQDPIDIMVKKGADYYVSTKFDDQTRELILEAQKKTTDKKPYKIIEFTDKFVIIQLVPDKDLPK